MLFDDFLPLELIDPLHYGDLDNEQIELIKCNAHKLVLIENATELLRECMMKDNHIEILLHAILKNTNITPLPSQSFPYENYDKQVNKYKRKNILLSNKLYASIYGMYYDYDGGIGHYVGVIIFPQYVLMFDSMQPSDNTAFVTLLTKIFQKPIKIYAMTPIPQETGGMSHIPPKDALDKYENNEMSLQELRRISIQSTESQNHFCYMWSIWFIHMYVLYGSVNIIIDPLIIIKKYTYNMLHVLKLDEKINHEKLYNKYFSCVWVWVDNKCVSIINNKKRLMHVNECFEDCMM